MHRVSDERSRSSSAIRSSIRARPAARQARPVGAQRHPVAGQPREFPGNLVERQPDFLREDDEGDAPQHGAREPAVAGARAF